jgi:hypothetical protein
MPRTTQRRRTQQSVEEQLALAERVLKGVYKSIDQQFERACDLEVERAMALYRSGKATPHNADELMNEARRRVG